MYAGLLLLMATDNVQSDHCIEIDKLQVKFDAEVCISCKYLEFVSSMCGTSLYQVCN